MTVHHPPSDRDRNSVPTLKTEVERLENTAQSADLDRATQAKIQALITRLETQLCQHRLSRPVQQELALLLSLLSNIKPPHAHLIDIAALAIAVLLDSEEAHNKLAPGKASQPSNHNLAFVRQTRLQLARQIEKHPHPIRAIFAGAGGAYNRLISGLSWFFVIFVLSPILSMGAVLLIFNLMSGNQFRELAQSQLQTLQTIDSRLEGTQQELQKARENRNTLDAALVLTINSLSDNTGSASGDREIAPISPAVAQAQGTVAAPTAPEAPPSPAPTVEPGPLISQRRQDAINRINQAQEISRRGAAIQEGVSATIQTIRTQDIRAALAAAESVFEDIESSELGGAGQESGPQAMLIPSDTTEPGQASASTETNDPNQAAVQQVLIKLLNLDATSFILVLSMGALGSAVSVIVRAKQFIEQSDGHADLFFVGFFRPIVGMTFAIFAIAIIQSGVSLNIINFGSPTRSDSQQNTQLYIVIAFIAGFSERLIKDVVGKTEDTLAGPTARSLPAERDSQS